jgi:hypothetical protein
VQSDPLNSPRWSEAPRSGFHEAWFVVATDARAGRGLWLRYSVDVDRSGAPGFALWGAWFEDQRTFALKNPVPAAAIGRTGIAFGTAELTAASCSGEVEGKGHALRWRLQFGQGAPGEELVPGWLSPVARLRGSGLVLPHPATTVSGAVEVDGSMVELQRVPAAQAHLWGRSRYPSSAWARCNSFAEDPGASIDLLDVEGPGGVHVPLFVFRFRGETHRFGELPWIGAQHRRPPPHLTHPPRTRLKASTACCTAAPETMVHPAIPAWRELLPLLQHRAWPPSSCGCADVGSWGGLEAGGATLSSKCGACLEFFVATRPTRVGNFIVSARAADRTRQRPDPILWQTDPAATLEQNDP